MSSNIFLDNPVFKNYIGGVASKLARFLLEHILFPIFYYFHIIPFNILPTTLLTNFPQLKAVLQAVL